MAVRISREYLPIQRIAERSDVGHPRAFRVKERLSGKIRTRSYDPALEEHLIKEQILSYSEMDVVKLRALPNLRGLSQHITLRGNELSLPADKMKEAYINAVIGRLCAREEEARVFEFIPTAENFYNLAVCFLQNGNITEARACLDEAAKYDKDICLRAIGRSMAFCADEEVASLIRRLNEVLNKPIQLSIYGQPHEGHILNEGRSPTQKLELVLELAIIMAYGWNNEKSGEVNLKKPLTIMIDFVAQIRAQGIPEWPYLEALLDLKEQHLSNETAHNVVPLLRRFLDVELRNVRNRNCDTKQITVTVDGPACPGKLASEIKLMVPTPLVEKISRIINDKKKICYEENSEESIEMKCLFLGVKPYNFIVGDWANDIEVQGGEVGTLCDSKTILYALDIAALFSRNSSDFLDNFKIIIEFGQFLIDSQIMPENYLISLRALGKRFPEYRGQLDNLLEKERARTDLKTNRPLLLPVHVGWYCDKLRHCVSMPNREDQSLPLFAQPVPWFTELLQKRYAPEELTSEQPGSFVPNRKCLVLDGDGILWEGVVDEVGVEGIRPLSEFQRRVKDLKESGVLLALNTRNDRSVIEEVFRRHADMTLGLEDFSAVEANWGSKADNLRAIGEKLGIGLNSLVFLDDTVQEREMVKMGVPEVFTPEVPEDAGLLYPFLEGMAEIFTQTTLTEEDKKRTKLYIARGESQTLLETATSREEGLRLLEMKADIRIGNKDSIPRLAQITQRTNQFNLTSRRYKESDIESLLHDPNIKIFSLHLLDKFADHGIVGLIIVRKDKEDTYAIDTFALSCRALGRTIERTFLAQVAKALKVEGTKRLRGVYFPTNLNGKVRNLYCDIGFTKIKEEKGATYWEFDMEKTEIIPSPWVPVINL